MTTTPALDSDNDSPVWAEVEVQKGHLMSVYRGRLSGADFARFQAGTLSGFLAIHDAYWSYDDGEGNDGWVVVGQNAGPYQNAQGSVFVRADSIVALLPLRDGAERQAIAGRRQTDA